MGSELSKTRTTVVRDEKLVTQLENFESYSWVYTIKVAVEDTGVEVMVLFCKARVKNT